MNLILFLLLALTASRTGLVQCEEDKEETEADIVSEDAFVVTPKAEGEKDSENRDVEGSGDGKSRANSDLDSTPNSDVNNEEIEPTTKTTKDLISAFMIIIPLLLTLVIIAVIVCVVMMYRRGRKVAGTKKDPYLDQEDHEKVPMPMFDDDIPSVMELEMEDLENWISKDGGKKVDTGQI